MSFANASKIARRELRGGLRGFRVFLACLALGVAAIAAVGSVRQSIERGLEEQGAVILGGDAEIALTYRFASEAEREWMQSVAEEVSEIVDFRSMAVVGDERGLTQIKGVDGAYPLYGAAGLQPEMALDAALDGADGLPGAVMDPVLIARLGLETGDRFSLGTKDFILMAALTREPDGASGGFGLGPRTLVRTGDLEGAGLLAPGTLFDSAYRLRLPPGSDLNALQLEAQAALDGAGLRWTDARNGAPGVAEFVDRLGAFLVLVGLAGLAVGGVGVSAAVRAYLEQKTKVIATLKTLGAETRTIFLAYALQIGVLTALGLVVGLALGGLAPLALAPIIEARLPVPAVFSVQWGALGEAALYGVLAAAVFTLWPLARTESVRAATLYRDGAGGARALPRWPYLLLTVALVYLLIGLAAWLSGLATLTYWPAAGLFAAFLLLLAVAWLTRRAARVLARTRLVRGRSALRMALGSVGGPGSEAGSVVLSLGLGLTVLAAVGQIDANLRGAIERDLPGVAPSYFVVDIQTAQLPQFLGEMRGDAQVSRVETAPMLRGVITQINGRPASEVAGDHWVLQGDRGITYSAAPPSGAEITAGTWWPEGYSGPPQVSFAAEEAQEMGLKLGDAITINVLGRDITAEVTSLRNVDFSTAGIGFILSMNPGALSGAPHTHIATVYAEESAEPRLLREVGQAYPNITMIRVRDAIARVTEVLGGIAAATTYGAMATLLTGLVVLIGAAAGWGVTRFVMETEFVFEPVSAFAIITGGALTTLLAGLAFAWRPLATRPARVLRATE
jgi:putative ABC transport system permease protein